MNKIDLLPLAIIEHHFSCTLSDINEEGYLSIQEICLRLNNLWTLLEKNKLKTDELLNQKTVSELNNKIAKALNAQTIKEIQNPEIWEEFISEAYHKDDLEHSRSWIFTHLYWIQLQNFKLSTCWFYYNLFNISHNLRVEWLTNNSISDFLVSLSKAGPPIYDGQTFYPNNYTK